MTLLPVILEKAQTYLEILDHFAKTGESFSLDQHTTNLTFDIIGIVTMGEDVNAQQVDSTQQGELIKSYKQLIKSVYIRSKADHGKAWLTPQMNSICRR